ncbi:unnamed protein product [Rotaria magnacalcarata]|uniref:Ubiquitin-like protein NEDD8 n=1 Tax=Rotaria magnacalcarata TaxID=392030 RepID=A0A815K765_9BILA|nr:unnamed protein product [Rotaria magnacalcarata]CAF1929922.1 unnamed protein product [Rotaria magnacalcarata]CAF2045467.1 unnamed protein product [Rotaria magnacalcarata]CAF2124934.1 unnamed protein product [Rotaria magnacalcarata]
MMIKVKTLTGKEIEVDIDGTDKIERIKERVEEKEGIPPPQQRLIFGGKQMMDDKTVSEYNVNAGSVLHLVLALRERDILSHKAQLFIQKCGETISSKIEIYYSNNQRFSNILMWKKTSTNNKYHDLIRQYAFTIAVRFVNLDHINCC